MTSSDPDTTSSSTAPTFGNRRFMSDDANKSAAALETARKEFRLALAGSSWVRQEDVARAAVAKVTSKHSVFKDRIQGRNNEGG